MQIEAENKHMVSVIIPNYNYRRFLKKRLKSIINQTYRNMEIVFLDDGSTDGSVELARKLLEHSKIPYQIEINPKNSGSVFHQWQRGLSLSRGEWVWFAEADDACHPRFLETLFSRLLKNPKNVLGYTDSQVIDTKNRKIWPDFFKTIHGEIHPEKWENDFTNPGMEEIRHALFIKNTIPNASAVVIKREAINNMGGIPQNWILSGDWATYLMLLELGDIVYCAEPLNYNRIHKNRVTAAMDTSEIYFNESLQLAESLSTKFQIPTDSQRKYIYNFLRQLAHSRGKVKLIDGFYERLKTIFPQKLVEEVFVEYFDKLVREQKYKDSFSSRLKRITLKKVINRCMREKI